MVSFRTQVLACLTVVCALLYCIFSYFQENQTLTHTLSQLQLRYTQAERQRKTFETKYETSHSNEEMYQTSNRQLKINLARTNKELAETVASLNKFKLKFTEAHLFYKDMKEMADVPGGEATDGKEKRIEANIVRLIKYKLEQWKSRLVVLEDLQRNHTQLQHKHRLLGTAHDTALEKHARLVESNTKLTEEKVKAVNMYDSLVHNYKNLTTLYTKHADVNKKLRDKLKEFRLNMKTTTTAAAVTSNDNLATTLLQKAPPTRIAVVKKNETQLSSLGEISARVSSKLKDIFTKNIEEKVNAVKNDEEIPRDNGGAGGESLDEEEKFNDQDQGEDPIDANGLGTRGGDDSVEDEKTGTAVPMRKFHKLAK